MSLKQCSLSLVINHMVNATWPAILENMLQGNQPYCHVANALFGEQSYP